MLSIEELKSCLRTIPDFPVKGVLFYDITTLLKNPEALKSVSDTLFEMYKDKGITKVAGLESRGFIFGPALAVRIGAGFVPIRKPGKLPSDKFSESYEKEYGLDKIEIHKDAVSENDVVLLHDDLLATGGSAAAAISLLRKCKPKSISANFIIELRTLEGREKLPVDVQTLSLLKL